MENQQLIADGIGMGESARWHGGRFWFADWIKRTIHAVDPDGTEHQSFDVPSFPITFDWLPDGELLVVSGSDGELLTFTPAGEFAHVATLAELSAEVEMPEDKVTEALRFAAEPLSGARAGLRHHCAGEARRRGCSCCRQARLPQWDGCY